jgi:hypothetical protein
MKKVQMLMAGLAASFLLTAFSYAPQFEKLKIIVDEIIFVTEGGGTPTFVTLGTSTVMQETPIEALKKLPTKHQKVDTTTRMFWYDKSAAHEGYFIRIEEVKPSKKVVTQLELKLLLSPFKKKVELVYPDAPSDIQTLLKPNVLTKLHVRLNSKSKISLELKCTNTGFNILNLTGPKPQSKYRAVIFSKNNI